MKCTPLVLFGFLAFSWAQAQGADQNETPPVDTVVSKAKLSIPELEKKIALNSKDFGSRIQLAEIYQERKSYDKMVETLRPASDTIGRRGLLLLASAYEGKKDHLNQIRVLENLLMQNDKDYYVHFKLGSAYAATKRHEDAALSFKTAKLHNTRFLPAYQALLKSFGEIDDKESSRTLLNDMIKTFGEKPQFYNELCRLYYADSFLDKAREICQQAIEKDPRFPDNHVHLGLTLKDLTNTQQAEKILYKAASQFSNSEFAHWAAGQFAVDVQNFAAAFKYFTQATKIDPKSVRSQLGLGKSALEFQKLNESLNAYIAACKLHPGSIREFRVAAGTIRKNRDLVWAQKFDAGMGRCPN